MDEIIVYISVELKSDRKFFNNIRSGHGAVGGDPHAQDLVGAQAQHVQDDGVELVQGPVDAVGQDGVVPAAQAQGAVGQGGGEAGVAPVQAFGVEQGRQDEVGEGAVLVDPGQGLQGDYKYSLNG